MTTTEESTATRTIIMILCTQTGNIRFGLFADTTVMTVSDEELHILRNQDKIYHEIGEDLDLGEMIESRNVINMSDIKINTDIKSIYHFQLPVIPEATLLHTIAVIISSQDQEVYFGNAQTATVLNVTEEQYTYLLSAEGVGLIHPLNEYINSNIPRSHICLTSTHLYHNKGSQ